MNSRLYLGISFFLLAASYSAALFAETKITNVKNASSFISSATLPVIYGGIAGSEVGGECSNFKKDSTCNNCEDKLLACNEKRIYSTLNLEISFTYKGSLSGVPIIKEAGGDTKLSIIGGQSRAEKGVGVLVISWSSICNNANSVGGCTISSSRTYSIGIEGENGEFAEDPADVKIVVLRPSDGEHNIVNACESSPAPLNGICQYELYPGDEKLFFADSNIGGLDLLGGVNYPNLALGERAVAIRAFFVLSGLSEKLPGFVELKKVASLLNLESYTDLIINSEGTVHSPQVRGLENGNAYFVRLSLLDVAGNMSYFTSDTQLSARGCDVNAGANSNISSGCKAIGVTDEVLGFLSKDLNCFVATAAYGTHLNSKLTTFREFRSEILLKSRWGQKAVFWYYKYGPKVSRYIHDKPLLRTAARVVLWPIWLFSRLVLNVNKAFAETPLRENLLQVDGVKSEKPTKRLLSKNERVQKFDPKSIRTWDGKFRRKIYHPNSRKGLKKITKELEYIYAAKKSPQKNAASFRFGSIQYNKLQSQETGRFFNEFYSQKNFMLLVDYEWQKKFLGRFALKFGSGLLFSKGKGQFFSPENQDRTPLEEFFFFSMPNNLSTVYKLQLTDRQFIVPYVESGLDVFTFMEIRDDKLSPKIGASYAYHFAAGLNINLGIEDSWATNNLDREYGINEIYFTIEYRQYFTLSNKYDLSGNIISAGFSFDI